MSPMSRALGFFRTALQEEEADFSIFLAAGPISVFCTLIVGLQRDGNLDLVIFAIAGTFFCMKARMRGWVYSALLLFLWALIKHAFFIESHHLWQMGIEASMLVGFAMSSAAMEQIRCKEMNLAAQIDSKESTIRNLEEDLAKTRQEALEGQVTLRDRLSELQKEFDENRSEISSLQVLNDVLRKTTAQTNQEREEIAQKFIEKDCQAFSFAEKFEKQKIEIAQLQEKTAEREFELNRLYDQMQGWTERMAERDQAIELLRDQLQAESGQLQNKILDREFELNRLKEQTQDWVGRIAERDQAMQLLKERLQSEEVLLQEKILEWEFELNRLKDQVQSEAEQIAGRDQAIQLLQERLQAAAQKEVLYLELRKQFDEKNRVLHRTRVELFQANTALEAFCLEQEQQKAGQMSDAERVLSNELVDLEQERQNLEQENEKLFDLVTLLSKDSPVQIIERLSKHKQNASLGAETGLKKQAPKKKGKKKRDLSINQDL